MLGALRFVSRDEVEKESSGKVPKKRKHKEHGKGKIKRSGKKKREFESDDSSSSSSDDEEDRAVGKESTLEIREDAKARRKEAGMEWMLKAPERLFDRPTPSVPENPPPVDPEELPLHPRELNPYLKSGTDEGGQQVGRPAPPVVGDGGASWRLKALKRAQEQAAREGRKLDEVVEERWGSLGSLTSSVAMGRSAHANAHLHAIRGRKGRTEAENTEDKASQSADRRSSQGENRDRGRYADRGNGSRMRVPQLDSSLSWRTKKKYDNQPLRPEDASIVRAAASSMNKFANDGSFLKNFKPIELPSEDTEPAVEDSSSKPQPAKDDEPSSKTLADIAELRRLGGIGSDDDSRSDSEKAAHRKSPVASAHEAPARRDTAANSSAGLTANQVAAKAMRLRLMGKVEEADRLTKDFEASSREARVSRSPTQESNPQTHPMQSERQGPGRGVGMSLSSAQPRDKIRDRNRTYDAELAGSITRNKLYKGNADDEYDYGDGCDMEGSGEKKAGKKSRGRPSVRPRGDGGSRIVTQQERCQFCFENADRPKHLVIAIANSTYLMIPPRTSLVPFHCLIVPMQHEGATRNVDDSVWQELRNFKKCLVQMFAKQGKEVLFLETVMALSRQRRHCYVECIPVPSDAAKDAPLYFKKAIDEAEDEWSQHNAKKLIDTRVKGLRNSIPMNFPYFHVEFGMKGGYAHVIDDENSFKSQFGRDVVAGLLELPEEDTYGHPRAESFEQQKKRVSEFLKLWEPFDWTKMLD